MNRKQKWDEDDFEGEIEEDYDDDLTDENLQTGHGDGTPGRGIMLLPHRQLHPHSQLLKARPGSDPEPRASSLAAHPSHSHLHGQDHADWTYEEQFRQVGLCANAYLWYGYRDSLQLGINHIGEIA